jgi:hypothetical protein
MVEAKRAGIFYATTPDGIELPIVDVTHPAFAIALDAAEQRARVDEFMRANPPRGPLAGKLHRRGVAGLGGTTASAGHGAAHG